MRRLLLALVVAGSQTACGSAPGPVQAPFADGSTQAVAEAVDGVTAFPTELDPRIFTGAQMKPDLHDATLRIVERIITDTGIKGLTVTGVELYGSNASYEYDDTSDFGVHVFVTSDSMTSQELAPILRLLNDDVERRQEGHVRFYGIPVEVSFHAERGEGYQPQPGVGQYSITDRRWVTMPTRQPDHFDRTQMTADMSKFISAYNDLLSGYQQAPKGFDCSKFGALDDEMAAYRDEGFTEGLGSRSTQNLVYRACDGSTSASPTWSTRCRTSAPSSTSQSDDPLRRSRRACQGGRAGVVAVAFRPGGNTRNRRAHGAHPRRDPGVQRYRGAVGARYRCHHLIGFRNSNAYNRWWEARTLWGGVIINCRALHNGLSSVDDGSATAAPVMDRLRRRQVRHAWQLASELRGGHRRSASPI